jgi:hypothetical protein
VGISAGGRMGLPTTGTTGCPAKIAACSA